MKEPWNRVRSELAGAHDQLEAERRRCFWVTPFPEKGNERGGTGWG